MLTKSFEKLLSGSTICSASSTIKAVSNSKLTYVDTLIASTDGKENSGKVTSIKSLHKYQPLSVKNAI